MSITPAMPPSPQPAPTVAPTTPVATSAPPARFMVEPSSESALAVRPAHDSVSTTTCVRAHDRMIDRAPARTRQILLVAALGPESPLGEVLAAASRLGLSGADQALAGCPGLFALDGGPLHFGHSRVTSAIRRHASAYELVATHQALADVCADAARAGQHVAAADEAARRVTSTTA